MEVGDVWKLVINGSTRYTEVDDQWKYVIYGSR